jgi:hypothetical protein
MTLSCNLGAAVLIAVFCPVLAQAQAPARPSAPSGEHRASDTVNFLTGALVGLAIHETGHVMFDLAFDAKPRVKGVRFGPFPFFAITHRDVSPRREAVISSAGFWMQEATSEWLLVRRPPLRARHAPFGKGVLAFNVLNSVGYGIVAFARAGPPERDTRGIADGSGVDERGIGAIVLAPAMLDAYRYFRPDARWATWASRAAKIGSLAVVMKRR